MRLFIALPFDNDTKEKLISAQSKLKLCGVRGNFTAIENLHLTLAFIGEARDPKPALAALGSVEPPSVSLRFSRPLMLRDILTAGLERNAGFEKYAGELRSALDLAGVEYDRKPFRGHVTLVRRSELPPGLDLSECLKPLEGMEIPVREICLMKTDFINNRPRYSRIGSVKA